jgi:hypothetical protein
VCPPSSFRPLLASVPLLLLMSRPLLLWSEPPLPSELLPALLWSEPPPPLSEPPP